MVKHDAYVLPFLEHDFDKTMVYQNDPKNDTFTYGFL